MAKSRSAAPAKRKAAGPTAAPQAEPPALPEATLEPIPELALGQLVPTLGHLPVPDSGQAANTLGMIRTFSGMQEAFGAPRADGRLLPLKSNEALFSLLGNRFGGRAGEDFALPDLRGRRAVGRPLETADGGGTALPVRYMIAADTAYGDDPGPGVPTPILGSIGMFVGDFTPGGWLSAEGQMLEVARYPALARLLGATYGGDGQTSFALPDLRGRAVIGAGRPRNSWQTVSAALGEVVRGEGGVVALGLNYIVCLEGVYPGRGGNGAFPDEPVIGEVVPIAGTAIPGGWAPADGGTLRISGNQALYSIWGDAYGGNRWDYFSLPTLTGRIVVGSPG